MDSYTLMVIPDRSGQVRRIQVSGRRLRQAAWAAGIVLLCGVGLGVDWARARLDNRELDSLRSESAAQKTQLEALEGAVQTLEQRLGRVSELERKVRVIADLPAPAERTVAPPRGLGGGEAEAPLPALSPEEADLKDSAPAQEPAESPAPISSLSGPARAARVAGLQARALQLARLAESRQESLAGLVDGLRGKSRRLASTPSIWPTEGWVTSRFGYRISPFTGRRQFHSGIDVASRPGMAVVAPARGRVVFAGKKGPMGRTVILDHGYGVRTTYGHNRELLVKRGEEVERGQKIASVGNSGRSTGPHLHYAVQVDGRRVNPMNYILDE
jgi:murein DD-endopeptidase MepM/ murein hydrolase activator NlpD